jgi:divalent metal cation (Fe/Co/Zn/Cd) transporter
MSSDLIANVLVLIGIGLLSVGAWLVHPAAGLAVAVVAVGIGIVRSRS